MYIASFAVVQFRRAILNFVLWMFTLEDTHIGCRYVFMMMSLFVKHLAILAENLVVIKLATCYQSVSPIEQRHYQRV